MNKRKISLIIIITVILTMGIGGCSKEKIVIVDTNVQDSKNTGVNISEETINLKLEDNLLYIPKYFEGDKIYGTLGSDGGKIIENGTQEYPIEGLFKKYLYTLEKDDSIKVTDKEPVFYSLSVKTRVGIAVEDSTNNLETDITKYVENDSIYYFNDRIGEKRKIGSDYSIKSREKKETSESKNKIIGGNKEFAYTMLCETSYYISPDKETGENKLINLEILGVNNGEKYEYKGNGISAIGDIIYSKKTEKFYAIDVEGKLYNIELKDNEVKFIELGSIDFKGLNVIEPDTVTINEDGEIVILNYNGTSDVLAIIYNPETKKSTYINKDGGEITRIAAYFPEWNKVILAKRANETTDDLYVGELKSDYIKIYTKLDITKSEEEISGYSTSIISDDGKKLLVGQNIFKPKTEGTIDYRYEYKILTFN